MINVLDRYLNKKSASQQQFVVVGVDKSDCNSSHAVIFVATSIPEKHSYGEQRLWVDCYGSTTERNVKHFSKLLSIRDDTTLNELTEILKKRPQKINAWIENGNHVVDYELI